MFALSDIIPIEYEDSFNDVQSSEYEDSFNDVQSLVPFVFNLPTHKMEKASGYIENIIVFTSDNDTLLPISFQRKEKYHLRVNANAHN